MSGRGVIGAFKRIAGLANSAQPTLITDGKYIPPWLDLAGRAVHGGAFPPAAVSAGAMGPETLTIADGSAHDLVAAPSAGNAVYVLSLAVTNTSATAVRIDIRDGTTVRISMMLATSGGGFVLAFPKPWKLATTAALTAILSASVTDVRVNYDYVVAVA